MKVFFMIITILYVLMLLIALYAILYCVKVEIKNDFFGIQFSSKISSKNTQFHEKITARGIEVAKNAMKKINQNQIECDALGNWANDHNSPKTISAYKNCCEEKVICVFIESMEDQSYCGTYKSNQNVV